MEVGPMEARTAVAAVVATSVLGVGFLVGVAGAGGRQDGRCVAEAARSGLVGRILDLNQATFVGGTAGNDGGSLPPGSGFNLDVGPSTVWCGFAGNDVVSLNQGWVLAGDGDDFFVTNTGTFVGGPGNDRSWRSSDNAGTFLGGPGDDDTFSNSGRFEGGPGNDSVGYLSGTFLGGGGNDSVYWLTGEGTFVGGAGDDVVDWMWSGTFVGGPGANVINHRIGGTCTDAIVLDGPPCD
jgi:hypothetical protein